MSRDSRFDKVEKPRKPSAQPGEQERDLSRFGVVGPTAPTEPTNVERPSPLGRFEGERPAVELNTDALAELPMLQCPSCGRDSSKFDQACIFCQASLTSPEATAYNLQLNETRRLANDTRLELEQTQREADVAKLVDEHATRIFEEERTRQQHERSFRRLIGVSIAFIAFVAMVAVPWFAAKGLLFFVSVLGLAAGLSPKAWATLGATFRR